MSSIDHSRAWDNCQHVPVAGPIFAHSTGRYLDSTTHHQFYGRRLEGNDVGLTRRTAAAVAPLSIESGMLRWGVTFVSPLAVATIAPSAVVIEEWVVREYREKGEVTVRHRDNIRVGEIETVRICLHGTFFGEKAHGSPQTLQVVNASASDVVAMVAEACRGFLRGSRT